MGGNVAVSIRLTDDIRGKNDPEIFRMDRWTGSLSDFISHPALLSDDLLVRQKHLNGYLDPWKRMRDDFLKNKETGNFHERMTSAYFPFDATAPSEYGLVVVDYLTSTIISCQYYTDPNTICWFPDRATEVPEAVRYYIENERAATSSGKEIHSIDQTYKMDIEDFFLGIQIDMSPWKIIDLGNDINLETTAKFIEELKKINFPLTNQCKIHWNKTIDQIIENIIEDGDCTPDHDFVDRLKNSI